MNSRYPKFWFFWAVSTVAMSIAGVVALIYIFGWVPVGIVAGVWVFSAAVVAQREGVTPAKEPVQPEQQFSEATAVQQ